MNGSSTTGVHKSVSILPSRSEGEMAAKYPQLLLSVWLVLTWVHTSACADSQVAPFDAQFNKVVLRTEYGDATHFVVFEWTADSLSMTTDLNHGRTVSEFNSKNRAYIFELLEDLYAEKSEADDPKCVRTHVQATFSRAGAPSVIKRGCLFPKDSPLSKKILGIFEVADILT
jgi:hypothetical protein